MKAIPTGIIRKIVLGTNPLMGMAFAVGQEARKGSGTRISLIIEHTDSFIMHGAVRYYIYYRKDGSKQDILWKAFINVPVALEYDSESDIEFV